MSSDSDRRAVIYIAFGFPPSGGGGIQRNLKFVKYLSRLGRRVTVVTQTGRSHLDDPSLSRDIPEDVEVLRFPTWWVGDALRRHGFTRIASLTEKAWSAIEYFLPVNEREFFWYFMNRRRILRRIRRRGPSVVVSSSFPVSTHLLALYLRSRRSGTHAWVADFRDDWVGNPGRYTTRRNLLGRVGVRRLWDRHQERAVVRASDAQVTVSEPIREAFQSRYGSLARMHVITNGYDEEDFSGVSPVRLPARDGSAFRIFYFGSLYGLRRPFNVLEGLRRFVDRAQTPPRIRLDIIGYVDRSIQAELQGRRDPFDVSVSPYADHADVLARATVANLLVLILGDGPGARGEYTGKLFEYIRLGVPIIATVPVDGVAARLVRDTATGTVVAYDDIESISSTIERYYVDWETGVAEERSRRARNLNEIERYRRDVLAARLNHLLETL